ncbi:unnamed protein product [Effrenium voratum]|uniref:Uncharacterized protein n=1 Tax=Effrenium voratum TaxID=2562239 RepID=A0AA36NAU2_9DINO|nr:unnamed protein product [Effrenium voratum]
MVIRPETSEEGPLLALGSGALYEVMFERVAIRSAPSTAATTLEIKQKGDALELFAWDESRLWRQCPADTLCNTAGWVMLDHPDFGPLVRPKGAPFCGTALAPLCRAAAEAQLAELRRFLRAGCDPCTCDAGGSSALALAAQEDARDCVVYLIEAGAVVSAEQGEQALRAAAEPGTAALIQALLGHQVTDTAALEDALTDLTLDARLTADRWVKLKVEGTFPPMLVYNPEGTCARCLMHSPLAQREALFPSIKRYNFALCFWWVFLASRR